MAKWFLEYGVYTSTSFLDQSQKNYMQSFRQIGSNWTPLSDKKWKAIYGMQTEISSILFP